MPTVNHKNLTGANLHEPKGADTASDGDVYVSDGAGSGSWHYLPTGWGYYKDNATAQTFNTTPALLSIDGAGSTTETSYLPLEIRGSGALWDTTNDKITPINAGDSYNVRLDLPITSETSNPTELTMELDIAGSTYGSSISVVSTYLPTGRSTPYTITQAFPIFTLSTFLANGGQVWLYTDTGSLQITAPAIYIGMNTNGDI